MSEYRCDTCGRGNIRAGSVISLVECTKCVAAGSGKPTQWIPKEEKPDMVNHPDHYKTVSGLETIDVIEAFTDGLNGIEATDTGNVIKYICRWKKKNGLEDLKKAQWYLNHLINHVEKESKTS